MTTKDQLPPLPEPAAEHMSHGSFMVPGPGFTAHQMHAYALQALTQRPAAQAEREAFEAAFSLVFEAYAKPADNFNSHEEWAIWQHGKVIKAFGLLQRFRAALQSPAPQTKGQP